MDAILNYFYWNLLRVCHCFYQRLTICTYNWIYKLKALFLIIKLIQNIHITQIICLSIRYSNAFLKKINKSKSFGIHYYLTKNKTSKKSRTGIDQTIKWNWNDFIISVLLQNICIWKPFFRISNLKINCLSERTLYVFVKGNG